MKQRKLIVFLCCFLSYTAIYIARVNLSMASPGLKESGIMNAEGIGLLGSVFLIVYACGRLLNGALSDVCPPWIMICSGLVLCGISNLIFGLFPPFAGLALLWGVNAFAQSMLWSSILRILTAIYDPVTVKKKTMYMVTAVTGGNILGILVNSAFISAFGLKFAFLIPGGIALICAAATFFTTEKLAVPAAVREKHIPLYRLAWQRPVLRQLIPAVMHGVMKDNISLWMAMYFVDRYNVNLNRSALFVLFIPCLGLVARLGYPAVYRLLGENEHRVTAVSFVICIPAALLLTTAFLPPVGAAVCLALIYAAVSLANTSFLSIYPLHFAESGNVASVSGLMDFATYCGAGIGSFVYGYVIEAAGYVPMYVSWAVISLISFVPIFLQLREKTEK